MRFQSKKIAIIGAGVTAASCVRELSTTELEVDIFEKSRGAGGRMATRRLDDGITADHGAQYFTSDTSGFEMFIQEMVQSGNVVEWPVRDDKICYVGSSHMNSPIKAALETHNLLSNHFVSSVERRENCWWLTVNDIVFGPYDYVVSTVPAPQVAVIIADAKLGFEGALSTVEIAPCWALMLVFEEPLVTNINHWRGDDEVVGWIGRNSSKPARNFPEDSWTIHASPSWSKSFLEITKEDAANILHQSFVDIIGSDIPQPVIKTAHRWRYAQTIKPLGNPYLSDASNTLFAGGDWCLGARVEYAFESGLAIAQAILDQHG
jgi:predicted NAD/FAD-dependent oxidoreductase